MTDKENIDPAHDQRTHKIGLKSPPIHFVNDKAVRKYLKTLEACEFEHRAKRQRALGTGAEGEVGLYLVDGKYRVAVKRGTALNKDLEAEAQLHWRATQCQQCINVKYIVPLLVAYHCKETNILVTVMPVYARGTLEDEMEAARSNTAEYNALLAKRQTQGLKTLKWLHDHCRMVHNDTHAGNWFVGDDDRILLADFGMARLAEQHRSTHQFQMLARYELLSFRFETSSSSQKRTVGKDLGDLEGQIESDPVFAK